VLKPVVTRYHEADIGGFFRGDAALANPDIYTFLQEENYLYAIRFPANQNLQRAIEPLLKRPVDRLPRASKRIYQIFTYQAKSWGRTGRLMAKVEWHPGELDQRRQEDGEMDSALVPRLRLEPRSWFWHSMSGFRWPRWLFGDACSGLSNKMFYLARREWLR